jgi:hypothetical protein
VKSDTDEAGIHNHEDWSQESCARSDVLYEAVFCKDCTGSRDKAIDQLERQHDFEKRNIVSGAVGISLLRRCRWLILLLILGIDCRLEVLLETIRITFAFRGP